MNFSDWNLENDWNRKSNTDLLLIFASNNTKIHSTMSSFPTICEFGLVLKFVDNMFNNSIWRKQKCSHTSKLKNVAVTVRKKNFFATGVLFILTNELPFFNSKSQIPTYSFFDE